MMSPVLFCSVFFFFGLFLPVLLCLSEKIVLVICVRRNVIGQLEETGVKGSNQMMNILRLLNRDFLY